MLIDVLAQLLLLDESLNFIIELEEVFYLMAEVLVILTIGS